LKIGPAPIRSGDGAARHRPAPAEGELYVDVAQEGAKLVSMAAAQAAGYEDALPRRLLFDDVRPRCGSTRRRSLAGSVRSCGQPDFEEAVKLVNQHEYGNGVAISPARRRRGARIHQPHPDRHGRGQRADPVPMAFTAWRLEALAFGDMAVQGMEGVRFYTRLKTVTARCRPALRTAPNMFMPTIAPVARSFDVRELHLARARAPRGATEPRGPERVYQAIWLIVLRVRDRLLALSAGHTPRAPRAKTGADRDDRNSLRFVPTAPSRADSREVNQSSLTRPAATLAARICSAARGADHGSRCRL